MRAALCSGLVASPCFVAGSVISIFISCHIAGAAAAALDFAGEWITVAVLGFTFLR